MGVQGVCKLVSGEGLFVSVEMSGLWLPMVWVCVGVCGSMCGHVFECVCGSAAAFSKAVLLIFS